MRAAVVVLLALLCISAVVARPVHKIHKRAKARAALVPYTAIPQLMLPTDATELTLVIADGTVTKATGVEMVWQALSTSTSDIKEIHTLAGGEDSVVPGRTWIFECSSWDGFADWASEHADHIASFATIDTENSIVEWKVLLRDGDGPSVSDCDDFATAIANEDLSGAMLIASKYFTQDLAMDSSSDAYAALSAMIDESSLYAERLDTSCLGYKFFSDYDSPVTAVAADDETSYDTSEAPTPPDEAPEPPTPFEEPVFSD